MRHRLSLRIRLSVFIVLMSAISSISKEMDVEGVYEYYDNGYHSRVECERIAAEHARIDALAKAFGTIVTQDFIQNDRVRSGIETNDLMALSQTEVKGEWLGDTSAPKYEYSYGSDNNLIVKCTVRGRAKSIDNEAVNFETSVLRNGLFAGNASSNFKNGDQMYLYFIGSDDGYLSVFLEDESRTVYNLLPYPGDYKNEVKVKKYKEYTFFSPQKGGGEFGPEEELIMTALDNAEFNRVYVVFSPERYSLPVMSKNGQLPSIKSADFTGWLLKARRKDSKMNVKTINLIVEP